MFVYIFPCILGFASALPLVLIGSTLQAWATQGHLPLMFIGYLALLQIPYGFKFLWAPFVDHYKLPFWRGHRRSWILTLLLCLTGIFYFLSQTLMPLADHVTWFVIWAALGALFSATLDICIDAYRTELFSTNDYGVVNAFYVSAYRLGTLVAGGLGLILAAYWGWKFTYQLMAFLLLLAFIIFFFSKEKPRVALTIGKKISWYKVIIDALKNLIQRKYIIWIVLLIFLYKFGEALGIALGSTFLLRQLHFSLAVVGGAYKTLGIIATIIGAFIGGISYKKYGLFKTFFYFGILQALGILWFYYLAVVGQNFSLMCIAISFESLTAGMATTVFLAFLMLLCQAPYTATQFALFSAVASIGRIISGPLASWLVSEMGWANYFLVSFASCIPGLILLFYLRDKLAESFASRDA